MCQGRSFFVVAFAVKFYRPRDIFFLDTYRIDIYHLDLKRRRYGRSIGSARLSYALKHDGLRSQEGFLNVVLVFLRSELRLHLPEPQEDGVQGVDLQAG